jgi:hypothetical protein
VTVTDPWSVDAVQSYQGGLNANFGFNYLTSSKVGFSFNIEYERYRDFFGVGNSLATNYVILSHVSIFYHFK